MAFCVIIEKEILVLPLSILVNVHYTQEVKKF